MKIYELFIQESVRYKSTRDTNRIADEEHGETWFQSRDMKENPEAFKGVHPAIQQAIHHFAANKNSWINAMNRSKIQSIKPGTIVHNSEIGQGVSSLDKDKVSRVKKQIGSGRIDRPIVLRHTDETGQQHHYLVAGNTRATVVGYGVKAHHIDV